MVLRCSSCFVRGVGWYQEHPLVRIAEPGALVEGRVLSRPGAARAFVRKLRRGKQRPSLHRKDRVSLPSAIFLFPERCRSGVLQSVAWIGWFAMPFTSQADDPEADPASRRPNG